MKRSSGCKNQANSGSKWIRPEKRLAIYIRDGLACVLCEARVNGEDFLSLDHVIPATSGGTNEPSNLITCCHDCNSRRRADDLDQFVFRRFPRERFAVLDRVERQRVAPLDVERASSVLHSCGGSITAAISQLSNPSDNDSRESLRTTN